MLKNILKTSIRNLLKNKSFTILNIMGLATGLTACLLITFYVRNELSFDKFNSKYKRIYRINTDLRYGGTTTSFAITSAPVAGALVNNFPGVENAVRLAPAVGMRFKKGNEIIQEDKVVYCDPSIFDIFTLHMIAGDPRTALEEPNSMVITESTAQKYFNETNVVGRSLFSVGDSTVYKITGVIRDIPEQSHFHFNFFISLLSIPSNYYSKNWGGLKDNTYILLKPGADYKKVETQFPSLLKENLGQDFLNTLNKHGDYMHLSLTPLKDIHLRSNRQRELEANSSIQYIYIFSSLAILILLIACINFMNLSTARYTNRVREIGVRKVLGSPRRYLIAQFLSESILITFFAAIIAVIMAWMLLPLFNQISGKEIDITLQTGKLLLPLLIIITLGVGILPGLYPAFFLSSFKPIVVLKGKFSASFKKNNFRNFLVIFQFAISVFLIIGTLVIYNQLNYIHSKNLGFNRDHVLVIENVGNLGDPKILKQQVKQIPGVINASLSAFLPTNGNRYTNFIFSENNNKPIQTQLWLVDADYIKTLEMGLVQGRDFSSNFTTDSSAIIINETAAKMLGFSNNTLNKVLYSFKHGVKTTYHIYRNCARLQF
jgi:putative ABC transport system permease protein